MMREEMKVTPSYEIRYHGSTNDVGKPLEDVAMANIQQSKEKNGLSKHHFVLTSFLVVWVMGVQEGSKETSSLSVI